MSPLYLIQASLRCAALNLAPVLDVCFAVGGSCKAATFSCSSARAWCLKSPRASVFCVSVSRLHIMSIVGSSKDCPVIDSF